MTAKDGPSLALRWTGARTIDLMELDTSSRKSIDVFVRNFSAAYPRLEILIRNAAYFNHGEPYRVNSDGIEIAFTTGADFYPAIAGDEELQDAVLQVCRNAHNICTV
jgi:NAD(P)-dependent dehydrogenase (short-subunit alcohol dehydrogenase family)